MKARRLLSFLVCLATCAVTGAGDTEVWVEDSHADFADGTLDAAGQNLYVSHDGTIRTIHRFDLDQDGWLDLIFNNTHDWEFFVPATQGNVAPQTERMLRTRELPVEGSLRVVLDDFDRDGHIDAVFCPNYSGLQSFRRLLTILYGAPEGWTSRRSAGLLPVHGAAEVAVCDLNADGWPDIAVLYSEAWLPKQPDGRIVRIFPGGERGFDRIRAVDIGIEQALDLASGDFDGDGARDLAVLRSTGELRILWASADGDLDDDLDERATSSVALGDESTSCVRSLSWDAPGAIDLVVGTTKSARVYALEVGADGVIRSESHDAFPATHISCGDLDGDGRLDLALTDFVSERAGGDEAAGAGSTTGEVRVLWGATDGFDRERALRLPTPFASATAIGDVDADGNNDLVVTIHQGKKTLRTLSTVHFGTGRRELSLAPGGIGSSGAMDAAIAPPDGELPARVVFANSLGGTVGEKVPLHVYWGVPGGFDPEKRTEIPFRSGYEASAADLDVDGFVDLVALDSEHAGASETPGGAHIFRGSANGFDFEGPRTVLSERSLGTSNIADLNKDGWLDLVLGMFDSEGAKEPEENSSIVIRYGSKDGFLDTDRVAIASPGYAIGTAVADFDGDAWLDVAVTSFLEHRVRIFQGGAEGFDAARQVEIAVPGPIALEVADLDADGHLDILVGIYRDPLSHEHDMGNVIFWGSPDGYREQDAQRLPGWTPLGLCVADFDGDGHLDIFSPHYVGERIREALPSYLYWGGADGFHPRRRTSLTCDSAHDAMAADFDRDGHLDLAVSCHSKDGSHATDSLVFYNDGQRFQSPRKLRLPTRGTHWMWAQDMGHIYDRRWRQTYVSSVHRLDGVRRRGEVEYRADAPQGTRLTFAVRSAATDAELAVADWRPLGSENEFVLSNGARLLQYRAELWSDNGDRYTAIERVKITLER